MKGKQKSLFTEHEHKCIACEGAGLLLGKLCAGCNGHGKVLFMDNHVYKWSQLRGVYVCVLEEMVAK